MGKVRLRRFPYPFRAMFSICNDIDGTDLDTFVQIHRYLNGELGLETGDSFWLAVAEGASDQAFSYFDSDWESVTDGAEIIREGCRTGCIDCLHTYGNFNSQGGFRRQMAETSLTELQQKEVSVQTWINHGDGRNDQNVLTGLGDLPDQEAYHMDLTAAYGIRFFWVGDLAPYVGQERPLQLAETYFSPEKRRKPLTAAVTLLKVILKTLLYRSVLDHSINSLIRVSRLRDGRDIYAFRRYGSHPRAAHEDLADLIAPETLERLIKNQGYMILYIHLGKRKQSGPVFPPEARRALENLALLGRRGDILTTTTTRLLTYHVTHKFLQWSVSRGKAGTSIRIEGIDSPVEGRRELDKAELEGLTFYVSDPEDPRLFLGEELLPVVKNAPDETGQASISLPWRPLDSAALFNKGGDLG